MSAKTFDFRNFSLNPKYSKCVGNTSCCALKAIRYVMRIIIIWYCKRLRDERKHILNDVRHRSFAVIFFCENVIKEWNKVVKSMIQFFAILRRKFGIKLNFYNFVIENRLASESILGVSYPSINKECLWQLYILFR